ncbi:phenylalanine--tRNA ligase subunit beta [Candidatus Woesearchaeota archaeon]|nr:phenylalanine--tRNA ligase subunit beta [Candidatus Woesearchaeota archaeon]
MPTIHLSRKHLEKTLGKKMPLEKLKDRISYLGTDLEGIEGDEITVEVFPNRPDMLSAQGFARALSSFLGINVGLRKYPVKKSNHKVIIENSVKKYRPYTACAIVKKLSFDDQKIKDVIEFQEKLHVTYGRNRRKVAIGIYPFEKIKTPIRFVARKPDEISFVPLESSRKMTGSQILTNDPTGRDYAHLLDGLDKYPLFIDANEQVLSMPPIINSETVGKITEQTKEVFIECSGFDYRVLSKCLNMIVTTLADMGGEIYSMELDYGNKLLVSPILDAESMKIDISYLNRWLGVEFKKTDVTKLLKMMGYDHSEENVLAPAYRADVMHQVDLFEDIAIAYGFENFKESIPNVATVGEEAEIEKFRRKIAYLLTGFGMFETSTFHLINSNDLDNNMRIKASAIELEKPSSSDFNVLRSWLLPCLMQVLRVNKHNEYPQKLFEIATVFNPDPKTETGIREDTQLVILSAHTSANYTEVRQYLDFLMSVLGIKHSIKETEHNSFIEGRLGAIVVNNKTIGFIGEIHPEVLQNFGLEVAVSALELDFNELLKAAKKD